MPIAQLRSYEGDCRVELSTRNPYQARPQPLLNENMAVCVALLGHERPNAWKQWTMNFLLTQPELFHDVVRPFAEQPNATVWVRLGVNVGERRLWSDWDEHRVVKAYLLPTGASEQRGGGRLILETADPLYEMSRHVRVASRQGTISQIATKVAQERFERLAVEDTTPGKSAYIQAYESDWDFLRRIQGAAVNRDGNTNYQMYVRGGVFHFHTPGWQVSQLSRLDYQAQAANNAANLKLQVLPHAPESLLGQGVTLIAADPYKGGGSTYVANPAMEAQFARQVPDYPTAAQQRFIGAHVGPNQLAELQARTQDAFASSRLGFYRAQFTLNNYPFLGLGDVIEFVNQSDAAFDGLWYVSSIGYALDKSVLTASVEMTREGYTPGSVAATNSVQGRILALGEIAASARTRPIHGGSTLPDGSHVRPVLAAG